MANTNYGTGLDFDIEQYRKKMKVVPKPEEEKKEEKKAEEKKEEKKSSKPRSETGSRILAQVVGGLVVSLVGMLLFILLGGPKIFTTGFEAREQMQTQYENLYQQATNPVMVNVQRGDGTVETMTWQEMVIEQQKMGLNRP